MVEMLRGKCLPFTCGPNYSYVTALPMPTCVAPHHWQTHIQKCVLHGLPYALITYTRGVGIGGPQGPRPPLIFQ